MLYNMYNMSKKNMGNIHVLDNKMIEKDEGWM